MASTPAENKTLVLIDGHSLAFRVYYGLERTNMRTSDGTPVWAVYGFLNSLFRLLQKIQPDAIAIAFDVSRITFRNDQYADYKANRDSMPEEMKAQMDLIRESVEVLGIPIYELPNYEADDVIGTLSAQAVQEGYQVDILTGDQDAFQLVDDDKVHVLIPPRTLKDEMKTYTRDEVFKKWGVYPEQVIDFKGLKGDTSDNIPGVPGVGDKTAAKLLTQFQTLEGVYEAIDTQKGKLRERLETYQEQAFLSKQLATIVRDAPIQAELNQCDMSIPDLEALFAFLDRMEFKTFRKQAVDLLKPFLKNSEHQQLLEQQQPSNESQGNSESGDTDSFGQLGLLPSHLKVPYTLVQQQQQLTDLVKDLNQVEAFALDIETTGLDVFNDALVGISIAYVDPKAPKVFELERCQVEPSNPLDVTPYPAAIETLLANPDQMITAWDEHIKTVYIPIAHETSETQLNESVVMDAITPFLTGESHIKLAHNKKFELNAFRARNIDWEGLVFDTMVASYADKPERRHGLKGLVEELFGTPMQPITELIGTGKKQIPFSQAEFKPACDYAACDAYTTLKLGIHFAQQFASEEGLRRHTLFYELENPVADTLAEMEFNGVHLDLPYLANLSGVLGDKLAEIEASIHEEAGLPFNINSPKQVGELLFERMGIEPTKKTKGKTGYSTDAKVLEKLASDYPIVQKILDYRQLGKLKSTYIDSLPEMANKKTGRIHTSFNQTVVATGRLSSSEPNLQNIPIRTEEGRKIRGAFIPRHENEILMSADYSQIELRLLAHVSEDPNLLEAFNAGEDIHKATAALVFDVPLEEVTKEQRYQAKAVNFGVIYGQTPHGLSQQLDIPRYEAAEFIDRYFERYPNVQSAIERIQTQAKLTGKVTTLFGRERDLSRDLSSSNRNVREFAERAAFNTVLQGSAADLMKLAMIDVHQELLDRDLQSRLILQVHDELVLGVPKDELDEVETLVRQSMWLSQPLKVPLVIDVEVGHNWMEQEAFLPRVASN